MKLPRKTTAYLWFGALLLCLLSACATKPKTDNKEYMFFPRPPDEPRIQFLTSFGTETDLGSQSKFSEFVVGNEKVIRPIWKPYGIFPTKGKLYICDTQPKNISIVDLTRGKINYMRPGAGAAMQMPINVAVDGEGNRYVTDTKRGQILVYGPDDRVVAELGVPGEMKPCGLALSGDRFYVTDMSNRCVRVYSTVSRKVLLTVPRTETAESKLFSPTNVAVDKDGKIYVTDTGAFAVQVYDAEGNHLRKIGDVGLKPGRFALPKGIGVDREGRIFVVDAAIPVAQVFDPEGKLLMFFGVPKMSGPGGLYLPAGLAIDYENVDLFQKYVAPGKRIEFLIYITNQAGTQKVSVFGFLKRG